MPQEQDTRSLKKKFTYFVKSQRAKVVNYFTDEVNIIVLVMATVLGLFVFLK